MELPAQVDGIEDESSSSEDDDDEVIPALMLCHGSQTIVCFCFRPLMSCVDVFLRRCIIFPFCFIADCSSVQTRYPPSQQAGCRQCLEQRSPTKGSICYKSLGMLGAEGQNPEFYRSSMSLLFVTKL